MTANMKPKLLHIEDNADIALIVSLVLSNLVDITLANTIEDARQKLTEHEFDLALLDLTLPDGSGLDLVADLKAKTRSIPVIIHSAHEVSETTYNVEAVLSKSHTQHDDLRDTVLELTGQAVAQASAQ